MHLDNVRERINEPKTLAKLLLHILAAVAVVHVQGDDGTAIVFATIGCMMLFAAGLAWKYILSAIALGVTGAFGDPDVFPGQGAQGLPIRPHHGAVRPQL